MKIEKQERDILTGLIGKTVRSIVIPTPEDSVMPPVSAILVVPNHPNVLIDSCARLQSPTETGVNYPQMRVRLIDDMPEYANGRTIDLSEYGEVVCGLQITDEEISSGRDVASYTKALHIDFTGGRDVTITRETFRNPYLQIYETGDPKPEYVSPPEEYATIQVTSI